MKGKRILYAMVLGFCACFVFTQGQAQTVTYSLPMGDNIRSTSFDIIGECNGNLMIYKRTYNDHAIALYDNAMKVIDIVPLTFLPKEVKAAEFVNLGDKIAMVYQYTHRRDIFCDAVLLNEKAQPLIKPRSIGRVAQSKDFDGEKVYLTIYPEDKSKIMVVQALRDEDFRKFQLHTFLLDTGLQLLRKDSAAIPYLQDSDRLDHFTLSASGALYFTMGSGPAGYNGYFSKLGLFCKTPDGTFYKDSVPMHGRMSLRQLLLKLDEVNGKVWITTLNYDDKLRNIDYLLTSRFRLKDIKPLSFNAVLLTDSLKNKLRDKRDRLRYAMNNYVLTGEIFEKDGGALVVGEKQYTDGRGVDHYDDLMLLSLDSTGNIWQAQKIVKAQMADPTDAFSSYLMINTGGAIHFLMNKAHRISRFLSNQVYLLSDYRFDASHQVKQMPLMRGLDSKKRWAPRYGEQISRNEVVIPCQVGSGLIFGKITY